MKSVSFSDIRLSKSPSDQDEEYYQMTEHDNQYLTGDNDNGYVQASSSSSAYFKPNSLNRSLTHYKSSEDILKRFERKSEPVKSNTNYQTGINGHFESNYNESRSDHSEEISQHYDKDSFIQDLKQQIELKDKTINRLQEEKIDLQRENDKLTDQFSIMDSRIKYLEQMLAAFTGDIPLSDKPSKTISLDSKKSEIQREEKSYSDKPNLSRSTSPIKQKLFSTNLNHSYQDNEADHYKQSSYFNSNDDIDNRPSSADCLFIKASRDKSTSAGNQDISIYNKHTTHKPYDSDSDERYQSHLETLKSSSNHIKPSNQNYSNSQRKRFDYDRSSNMSNFINRLDQFTKYAQKTAEKNSLKSTSLTNFKDYRTNYNDDGNSRYTTAAKPALTNDNRPPLNPYHRSKKFTNFSNTTTTTSATNHHNSYVTNNGNSRQDFNHYETQFSEEDENLKDRVKRILERHNYLDRENDYSSDHRASNYSQGKSPPVKSNARYPYSGSNELKYVPKLDLTANDHDSVVLDAETNDLLAKYLTYPDYQYVI